MKKIAVGGIAVECCSFSPLATELADFKVLRGADLLAQYPFIHDYEDVTFVPMFYAKALPGGPVNAQTYAAFKAEFLAGLKANGPWDGVYLELHGAMFVAGMQDAEGDWLSAVREVVGTQCLLVASYDLHGNVSPQVIAQLDSLTAYRTAPHTDVAETRARAVALLVDCLREAVRPVCALVNIPILLPGEKAMTTAEPAATLYNNLPDIIARYGLLDASFLVGYAWVDEPRVAASAVVVGRSLDSAQAAVLELAGAWWEQRANFRFGMTTGSIDACLGLAQEALHKGGPVFISDAGDNITGGGVGDVPVLLERLLAAEVKDAVYAALVDAEGVAACKAAGLGATLTLSLGGKLDTAHGVPLEVTGSVLHINNEDPTNCQVILQVAGVKTILTQRRTAFTTLAQFSALEINLTEHDLVAVKLGYLFPELREVAKAAFLAFSPGAINPSVEALPYQHLLRPVYPLEPEMSWEPRVFFGTYER